MDLREVRISQEIIETSGGNFAVRGLTLTDILRLAEKHYAVMAELFAQFAGLSAEGAPESYVGVATAGAATKLLKDAPDAAAEVIALAAGAYDADGIAVARNLTFTTQIEALDKIGGLTFKTEEDLGNAVAAVIAMLKASTGVVRHMTAALQP